uniref:Nonstructural protein n=1 Tax=Dulem virus 158 TaxID=3145635 RepID=A0AAU8B863_9VIRU
MIYGIYAIKDAKTTFMPLTCDYNDASAIRNFEHACQEPSSLMRSHAKDFSLWFLGSFNNETGQVDYVVPMIQIADGASFTKE